MKHSMRNQIWLYFIISICVCVKYCRASTDGEDRDWNEPLKQTARETLKLKANSCWMSLKAQELFRVMEKIDNEYAAVRKQAQQCFDNMKLDKDMIEDVLFNKGIAGREVFKKGQIPSGIHLGGLCMIKLPYSIVGKLADGSSDGMIVMTAANGHLELKFFHRMKLREDTSFQLNYLHNDIENMVLRINMSLNTLHLTGAYDRSMLDSDPSALIYSPSFGELQVVMKDVQYTVQGRYRLITERLVIELIVSTLDTKDIVLRYVKLNETEPPIPLEKQHVGDFMMRLKADLDKWLQDYFNDYLIMTNLDDVPTIAALQKYDRQKATELAVFTDDALTMMNKKLRDIGGDAILLPDFKILTSYGLSITMHAGTLRGLNTMFRRSVATTILERTNLRYVDAIIGFSDMKVSYDYEINFPPSQHSPPTLNGVFIMSTNELTAHLSLGFLNDKEMVELDFDFIKRMGVESITVEGGANLHIANFKHLLHHEIATIMSSSVTYGVRLLKTLPKCEPFVPGMLKKKTVAEIVNIRSTPQYLVVLVPSKEKISTEDE